MASGDRAPQHLVVRLTGAVRAERETLQALGAARAAHRVAVGATTAAVAELRGAGVLLTTAARVVATGLGMGPTPEVRQRIAARLRKRLARSVTVGHADPIPPPTAAREAPLPSQTTQEPNMSEPKLIKRVTTEEFLDVTPDKKKAKADEVEVDIDADEERLDGLDDEDCICDDEPERARARRRKR